ncbi:MAG: tetraprenyl-beta-curcumene synthase family protein, partial [Betaproteobacteria bacterium]
LKAQGLASIRRKRFHAIGGSVYSLESRASRGLVTLVVAYQTISDYLDNLCDRAGVFDPVAFGRLHQSMLDALSKAKTSVNGRQRAEGLEKDGYYGSYPWKADGGYLRSLVEECNRQVARLPGYDGAVEAEALRLAQLYTDLQVRKHAAPEDRVPLLLDWWRREKGGTTGTAEGLGLPDIAWWEFAAASGSTLGIFALFSFAAGGETRRGLLSGPSPESVRRLSRAYFPWVGGLHILLDYLIDLDEDAQEGDLNFVSFYRDEGERRERLGYFVDKALQAVSCLPNASFHEMVVKGLLAMYLSDPKVVEGGLEGLAAFLLAKGGPAARCMWHACRLFRRTGLL